MSTSPAGAAPAGGPRRGSRRLLAVAAALAIVALVWMPAARADDDDKDGKTTTTAADATTTTAADDDATTTTAGDDATTTTAAGDGATTTTAAQEQQPAANDCTLTVPDLPLTARGLATPWVLGGCREDNPDQGAFVEATILDPATGALSVYRPLVVDARGPAVAPSVPTLPPRAVVSLNIGFQGDNLTLQNQVGIAQGRCVNGLPGDIFGQVAFCNNFNNDGTGFFEIADTLISEGKIKPPLPAIAADGKPCPTVWTYDITDQDPVDNTTTSYLVDGRGRTAQNIAANAGNVAFGQVLANGSDAGLLANRIDPALPLEADPNKTCQSGSQFRVTDITAGADSTVKGTTLALESLQAAVAAAQPGAQTQGLLAIGGPFVTTNGKPNLAKLNLYRQNVNQPTAATNQQGIEADPTDEKFCRGLIGVNGLQKVAGLDKRFLAGKASPDPAAANDLFNNMMFRFVDNSFGPNALDCETKIGVKINDFLVLNTDTDGVVVNAQVNLDGLRAASAQANAGAPPVLPLTLPYVPRGQGNPTPTTAPGTPTPTTAPGTPTPTTAPGTPTPTTAPGTPTTLAPAPGGTPAPRPTVPVLVADHQQPRVVRPLVVAPPPTMAPALAPTATTVYQEGADEGGGYQEGAAAAQARGNGGLPYTGGPDPALIVSIAMALLSAGGLLIMAARYSRSSALRRGRH